MCTLEEFSRTFDKWVSLLSKSLSLIFLAISIVFWGDRLKIQLLGTLWASLHRLSASVVSRDNSILLWIKHNSGRSNWGTEPECMRMRLFSLYSCLPQWCWCVPMVKKWGAWRLEVSTNDIWSPSALYHSPCWHILYLMVYSLTFLGSPHWEPEVNSCLWFPSVSKHFLF